MNLQPVDSLWIMVASALVFVMQGGFALLESGVTRSKNSINVAIKNLTDLGISLMVYWGVGFGLMFGVSFFGLIGSDHFVFHTTAIPWKGAFFVFQAMFCSTAATIVSGAVAERMRFSAYILVTIIISFAIYPVIGHWIWGGALFGEVQGWLGRLGFVDFAGSTVVHSVGGWVSLSALLVLGPRLGRYNPDNSVNPISGSNIPNAVTGVILLWFGWFGFNGGSTLAMNDAVPGIILRTVMAAAAGMTAALAVGWPALKVADVSLVINGSVGGLVAITANAHVVHEPESVLIGAVGGIIAALGGKLLDRVRIDDAVSAIPAHLFAGIWGTLAVGLFGDLDILDNGLNRLQQIGVQSLGIGVAGLWALMVSYALIWVVDKIIPLRVTEEDEIEGLNSAEHGATTEIYDLYKTLDEQSKTGDLNLRAPVEPFTEVGQIASMYNKVLDHLQQNVVAKSEYTSILDNVNEGLFLIDRDFVIGPYYSGAMEAIFRTKDLAGQSFSQLLNPLIGTDLIKTMEDFLPMLFDEKLDWKSVRRLNPLSRFTVKYPGDSEDYVLSVTFQRLMDGSSVNRVMGVARDLTEQARLEQSMDQVRREKESEMDLFYKILHMDPSMLAEFVHDFDSKLEKMNLVLEKQQGSPRDVLKSLGRLAHGLKGEAALLELDFIVEATHRLESLIDRLRKKSPLENADFLNLTIKMSELQQTGQRMRHFLERIESFKNAFLDQESVKAASETSLETATEGFVAKLTKLAERIARDKGKEVSVDAEHLRLNLLSPSTLKIVKDILVQLVRNSVVHGIEDPNTRIHRGKNRTGKIRLEIKAEDGFVELRCQDDGQGLDVAALRKRALESGKSPAEVSRWGRADYLRYAFSGDVSTAEVVDQAAGRGLGMSWVREQIKNLGGKISVTFREAAMMDIRIRFPQEDR